MGLSTFFNETTAIVDNRYIMGPKIGESLVTIPYNDPKKIYAGNWLSHNSYLGGMLYLPYNEPTDGSVYFELPVFCNTTTLLKFYVATEPIWADSGYFDLQENGVTIAGPENSISEEKQTEARLTTVLARGQHVVRIRKLEGKSLYTQQITLEQFIPASDT